MFPLLQDVIDLFVCVCVLFVFFFLIILIYLWFTSSVGASGLVAEANDRVRPRSHTYPSCSFPFYTREGVKKNTFTSCGKVNLHPGFNFGELWPGEVTATTNSKDVGVLHPSSSHPALPTFSSRRQFAFTCIHVCDPGLRRPESIERWSRTFMALVFSWDLFPVRKI